MINKNIPGHLYQGATQICPYTMYMLMDTDLVESYSSYTSSTTIYSVADAHITDLRTVVNNYFGKPVITKSMDYYIGLGPNENNTIPTYALSGLNVIGVNINTNNVSRDDYSTAPSTRFVMLNGCTWSSNPDGYIQYSGTPMTSTHAHANNIQYSVGFRANNPRTGVITLTIYREDLMTASGAMCASDQPGRHGLRITIDVTFNSTHTEITAFTISVSYGNYYSNNLISYFTPAFTLADAQDVDKDPTDPYEGGPGGDGNDGGDGEYPPETTEPTDFPDLPDASAASCGLITMYTPTLAQLQSLGAYLWSGLFDPDTWKKVFNDPMDAMVGLAIVPAIPSSGGSKNIRFGNVDTGVNSSYLSTQYVKKKFGSVKISKDVGSFLDFTDTQISIYLPYLGFRTLSADDIMGATLTVEYNIDVLTGACAAFIKSSARGVLYAYNGSCITNVPITAQNFSGAIQNAVSAVASGVGVLAGMATGAAPVTAMSAVSMLKSAANVAINSKPDIQRSGNLGGSAGILSVQKPFIIIQRANYDIPSNLSHFVGNVTWKAGKLSGFSGFTMVEQVHLEGITATAAEKTEIETLLKAGVIL